MLFWKDKKFQKLNIQRCKNNESVVLLRTLFKFSRGVKN